MPLRGAILAALFAGLCAQAQPGLTGWTRVKLRLERLERLGSVLMIAAHPDDENTALLAAMAKGWHMRTAYLSLTRGEGGQNLIGPEQSELLGVIRTQELMAARRIDGAEQFFTRAIDFGFSKTAEETLAKWGREQVLSDVVWTIRSFRPDVIVLRFSGTGRDGHGHHQSSGILGLEAFEAAADPKRFPEQLGRVRPWRARRIFWNSFSFTREMEREAAAMPDRLAIDVGEFSRELGYSFAEIAGMSRSMHRSQGFGSAERRGSVMNYLTLRGGDAARGDPFEGIDTTWSRVKGGEEVGRLLSQATRFAASAPERVVPTLVEARRRMAGLEDPWVELKRRELDEAIADAAGLWLDFTADRPAVTPGAELKLSLTALNRLNEPVTWEGVEVTGIAGVEAPKSGPAPLKRNELVTRSFSIPMPAEQPYSQPFWLRGEPGEAVYQIGDQELVNRAEPEAILRARFRLRVTGEVIEPIRDVVYRWVDPVRGEQTRPVVVAPPVAVEFGDRAMVFPDAAPRGVEVQVRANQRGVAGVVRLEAPPGWRVQPGERPFRLADDGETTAVSFEVTPPEAASSGWLRAAARVGAADVRVGMRVIDYDHIPPQIVFPEARLKVARADARLLVRRVGYVMGAGDDVPAALRQLGAAVSLLGADELVRGDLSQYEAIVTGVRAYNVRKDLRAAQPRLLEYVARGGTLVVQYNVLEGGPAGGRSAWLERLGPLPIRISRDRVTVEEAPLVPIRPDHPLLTAPNRITAEDYRGWIQERGLYFAGEWDPAYEPIWESGDPGERPTRGATLYLRHGQGVYIFTPLAWFRQLPAGVPGAYRLFANLLSAGKSRP